MLRIVQNVIARRGVCPSYTRVEVSKKLLRWTSSSAKPYRAAVLEEFNEKLNVETIRNRAKLGDGMVRVGVDYCSLNLIDVAYMTQQNEEILLPMIPGSEFAGEVLEIGDNCRQNFKTGDKVAALLAHRHLGGGLAEECVVSEDECFDVSGISLENAAVVLQGHGAALLAFSQYCVLEENDSVVVIAGPGGNGLAAIQLASRVYKAKVYAICDTEDTSALLRDEGAHKSISINEGPKNVYKFLESALKKKKAKAIYDAAGGETLHIAADFLQSDGCLFTADPFYTPEKFAASKSDFKKPEKKEKNSSKSDEMKNDISPAASDIVSRIQRVDLSDCRIRDLDLYRQILEDTLQLCKEEIITPYISKKFALRDVNKAVKFIKEKKCTGKVLIDLALNDKEDPSVGKKKESE